MIHIKPSVETFHQYIEELSPSSWLYRTQMTNATVIGRINTFIQTAPNTFQSYRDNFISQRLKTVYHQHSDCNNDLIQNVTDATFDRKLDRLKNIIHINHDAET